MSSLESGPFAHSARDESAGPDLYARHVHGTIAGAVDRCEQMLEYSDNVSPELLSVVKSAAIFHDLGKLDADNQAVLGGNRKGRLKWDHIDAGVAHLSKFSRMSAWLVRAHHAPGLPERQLHFNIDNLGRKLRGRRHDDERFTNAEHELQASQTDRNLENYLACHDAATGGFDELPVSKCKHGLDIRLALSCLVDADHSDTSLFDSGESTPVPVEPRWDERLASLKKYIANLPKADDPSESARNIQRNRFFESCCSHVPNGKMFSCDGPVGIGKTTSVTAFLISQAIREKLRRIIIVAPYTNILVQTADTLKNALILPDENGIAERVIVEQHHRADFSDRDARALASLWNAPIVLTSAVSFFETLSACDPATLRKLHYLPGSAVFLDEAHAAIPINLWPQNWNWICQLANQWRCRFVFASGTLTKFWENEHVVDEPTTLEDIFPDADRNSVQILERRRVRYESLNESRVIDIDSLCKRVVSTPGPRLIILNTVQNAAIVAKFLRDSFGHRTLHLSTALAPIDREIIYRQIKRNLSNRGDSDWTLVATSCVEAGVDFSFHTAFRERFSATSILQVGGRVNRNAKLDSAGGSTVYDFELYDINVSKHPAAKLSAPILLQLMENGDLNKIPSTVVATLAMEREILAAGGLGQNLLKKAEREKNYPAVKSLGRVITADTRLVVVKKSLSNRLEKRELVGFRELLNGSVQLWAEKIAKLGMEPFRHFPEIYQWMGPYDPEFLGYMDGLLRQKEFMESGGGVI